MFCASGRIMVMTFATNTSAAFFWSCIAWACHSKPCIQSSHIIADWDFATSNGFGGPISLSATLSFFFSQLIVLLSIADGSSVLLLILPVMLRSAQPPFRHNVSVMQVPIFDKNFLLNATWLTGQSVLGIQADTRWNAVDVDGAVSCPVITLCMHTSMALLGRRMLSHLITSFKKWKTWTFNSRKDSTLHQTQWCLQDTNFPVTGLV